MTFAYHGIAKRELESAMNIAKRASVKEHRLVRLPDLREAGDIPGFNRDDLPSTYIPQRNSIFYAFAASYAEEFSAGSIVGGHNQDDERVFGDVSSSFFDSLQMTLWTGSAVLRRNRTRILRPLKELSKAEVLRLASSKGVPFELTWSCHRNVDEHCWKCEGCLSRMRAFERAGVKDPLMRRAGEKIT